MKTAMQAAFEKAKIMISTDVTKNQRAFLDMIAWSELGADLLAASNNGYDVIVTSTAKHPILFTDYGNHPHRVMELKNKVGAVIGESSAAGRYQLLARYFDAYKKQLNLPDFSPTSQDQIALQQIKECHALADIETGAFESAIHKVCHIWASMEGANYDNQKMHSIADLKTAFINAGGVVA